MGTWYCVLPGTVVSVSRDGSDFKPHTTRSMLQFKEPTGTTDGEMIFAKGNWRVLVERAKVVVSTHHGQQGWNQWGA
jgi:hypothetical protein